MAKSKKKVEDALTETVAGITKDISDTVKAAVSVAAGGDEHAVMLRRLQQQYSKATLKIYRKGSNNRDELFVVLEGQDLKEIEEGGGLDTLCLTEGGGGQYVIQIVPPGGNDAPQKIGPLNVSGAPPRMIPRSKELHDASQFNPMGSMPGSMAGFGTLLPGQTPASMGGFGNSLGNMSGGNSSISKGHSENSFQIKDIAAYMQKQSGEAMRSQEQAADRIVMMQQQQQQQQMMMQQQMQQQQRESSQQMMTLLASMFQNNNNNNAPAAAESAEIRVLKEKLDQMERQREQDERFRAQERQMEELKRALELQRVENNNKSNPATDLLLPLLTSQQTQAQAQQTQMLEIMRMANDKPGEDEKMSNIFSTLTMSNQATMNMIMEIARSGLLGGGDDHPIRDAILQGLDAARDLGIAALTRNQEEEPQQQQQVVMEPDVPMPEAPVPQLEAHEANLAGLAEEGEEETFEATEELEQEGVLEEELDRFTRDAALQRIIASLMNNDHVSDATARLYGHATSGNSIAAKWLSMPEKVTKQIFELFEIDEYKSVNKQGDEVLLSVALIENIYDFSEFMRANGDANKWAKTGYKPLRKRARKDPSELEPVELVAVPEVVEPVKDEGVVEVEHPVAEDINSEAALEKVDEL